MSDKEEDATSALDNGSEKTKAEIPESTTNEDVPPQSPVAETSSDVNISTTSANSEATPAPTKDKKIEILLKATGDAPIMTKKKWAVKPDQTIGSISEFIKKFIKLGVEERLFLYINQAFAPAPDQTMKNLYDCYGTDGKLIIHYCKSQAWG
ncbi:autophagy protein 12-like [Phymastichus coffea]|uniref:autophagy protein 12-like n=1 Tax=Phymastichus coffea TaxID=108790 RepID=UPI00273AE41D|nr:autophagy protein 12-like [Phymastichus coffea]